MKKTWDEPRIEVQKFVANEYIASCNWFDETNVIVTTPFEGGTVTDGRTAPLYDWQGEDKGFKDDYFDYLNASDADTLPNGGKTGWYSTTIDKDILANMGIVFHKNSAMPQAFTSSSKDPDDWYGNHEINDVSKTVYFWGDWPKKNMGGGTQIDGNWFGPNAS